MNDRKRLILVVVLVAATLVILGRVLFVQAGEADEIDARAAVPRGANAPTENNDLETLRHIKEMTGQQQGHE